MKENSQKLHYCLHLHILLSSRVDQMQMMVYPICLKPHPSMRRHRCLFSMPVEDWLGFIALQSSLFPTTEQILNCWGGCGILNGLGALPCPDSGIWQRHVWMILASYEFLPTAPSLHTCKSSPDNHFHLPPDLKDRSMLPICCIPLSGNSL